MEKKHLFVSYCHVDLNEVQQLVADLEQAGLTVWWDKHIPLGADWQGAIRRAVREAFALVVCVSRNSELQYQHRSGIFPELADAIGRLRELNPAESFIFPVKLSQCELPYMEIDTTRTLDRLQHVELFPAESRLAGISRLVDALKRTNEHP